MLEPKTDIDAQPAGANDGDSEKVTQRGLRARVGISDDAAIGGALGLVGGAIIGGAAGGPLGAVIGGVAGAIAADVAVEGIEHATQASAIDKQLAGEDDDRFSNEGASTADFDAETGVTRHDYTVGDINATDHTIFGSYEPANDDDFNDCAPRYRNGD